MRAYVQDNDFVLFHGDCVEVMESMDEESVQSVVTSPPYYKLRDYSEEERPDDWEKQIGWEKTPHEYVENIVRVMSAARRVLRKDGVLLLNLGDSFAAQASGRTKPYDRPGRKGARAELDPQIAAKKGLSRPRYDGIKPKDKMLIPHRCAIALMDDGWYVRMDIVWEKQNAVPESVVDRPTIAHEYVFVLSRSSVYRWNYTAIREEAKWERWGDQTTPKYGPDDGTAGSKIGERTKEALSEMFSDDDGLMWRNSRSVWSIPTESYGGDHKAVMPVALADKMVLASSFAGDVVLDPFLGSGTTALACRRQGRTCFGIELSADSAKEAARRLAQLSLLTA